MQSLLGISSFLIYTARGEILTVDKAFVSVSLLNIMLIPLIILPIMVGLTLGAAVAAGRVNNFLISDEINKGTIRSSLTRINCISLIRWKMYCRIFIMRLNF